MRLVLVRHGPTDWNAEKRVQGHIDNPLSEAGIRQVRARKLPATLRQLTWYISPMLRARHTAELMNIDNPIIEQALIEMHWGDWEGKILKPLRKQLGETMLSNEMRGLDFRPPNGESPRQVQQRLQDWMRRIAKTDTDSGAVVHKGIIRCTYALAHGWDMCGDSPIQFDWDAAHTFQLSADGELEGSYISTPLVDNDGKVRIEGASKNSDFL